MICVIWKDRCGCDAGDCIRKGVCVCLQAVEVTEVTAAVIRERRTVFRFLHRVHKDDWGLQGARKEAGSPRLLLNFQHAPQGCFHLYCLIYFSQWTLHCIHWYHSQFEIENSELWKVKYFIQDPVTCTGKLPGQRWNSGLSDANHCDKPLWIALATTELTSVSKSQNVLILSKSYVYKYC